MPDRLALGLRWAFVAAALAWALFLPLAAIIAASPGSGIVVRAPNALAYAIGALICHQQTARSFAIAGAQLPVCARCTGIYAGAAAAAAFFIAASARPRRPLDLDFARAALLASALPIVVTVLFEWTTGITPSNTIRAASGVPLGAVVAWVIANSPRPSVLSR